MIVLGCSVRDCGLALASRATSLVCARGHAFDRARSGYVNLLQPHDRRSLDAGDTKESVLARRRLYERGVFSALIDELDDVLAPHAPREPVGALETRSSDREHRTRTLDVGCGEGSLLAELARRRALDAVGLDLSVHAVERAARDFPELAWIVANGDRRLPIVDGALDLVLSITARRNVDEFARVLALGGRALIVVPAHDDLIELRTAVLGEGRELVRGVAVEFAARFDVIEEREVRTTQELDRDTLADLLAATYRGARRSQQDRAATLERMRLTLSWHITLLSRR